jgi:ribosomal protein L4
MESTLKANIVYQVHKPVNKKYHMELIANKNRNALEHIIQASVWQDSFIMLDQHTMLLSL